MNVKLGRMQKEAAEARFNVLSPHLLRGTGYKYKSLNQDSCSPARDSNPRLFEYEAGVRTTSL
jgi:hypothetical protein